jgi:hypothetical protein
MIRFMSAFIAMALTFAKQLLGFGHNLITLLRVTFARKNISFEPFYFSL